MAVEFICDSVKIISILGFVVFLGIGIGFVFRINKIIKKGFKSIETGIGIASGVLMYAFTLAYLFFEAFMC